MLAAFQQIPSEFLDKEWDARSSPQNSFYRLSGKLLLRGNAFDHLARLTIRQPIEH
jgi:hypothetical protein